ncbi:MAG: LD-carboxypeptidase [Muribaculaceae bacterium]|nr:LD-carboxypeptidase [Muribaculaceae bacterium]
MIKPAPLHKGDKIAIVSPAGIVNPRYVEAARLALLDLGYLPNVAEHCTGVVGSYSGTFEQRRDDLLGALSDEDIKAVLCSRGGYGAVHLIDSLPAEFIRQHPKWLIGFSDITALHEVMVNAGVCSIHGSMAKHLALFGIDNECTRRLVGILEGEMPRYSIEPTAKNRNGEASGQLIGGNMAVMCSLLSTKVDFIKPDTILFIEDINEDVYKVERMLYTLRLNGILATLKGLIVGQFTRYARDERNNEDMNDMVSRMVAPYSYPTAYNFPIGHIDQNIPLIEGANVYFSVTESEAILDFSQ